MNMQTKMILSVIKYKLGKAYRKWRWKHKTFTAIFI